MSAPAKTLEIRTSPHILSGYATDAIMFNVVVALAPVAAFAVWAFGWAALASMTVAVAVCVAAERAACRWAGRPSTTGDWSIVITGLLLALTLPPALPLWMTALGAAVATLAGKAIFGGLGQNPFNPALVGRAFLQAAFPAAMTTWTPAFAPERFTSPPAGLLAWPLMRPAHDAVTAATPLARWKFAQEPTPAADLFLGATAGSAGETSALLILAGGLYLIARNMMNWRIPAAVLGAAGLVAALLHAADPARYATAEATLLSGGLMLGAMFMASDMVGSPLTHRGCVVYGVLIGVLVVAIRAWGALPEGVMYAILLGNAATPHIDRLVQPRLYGARPAATAAKEAQS